MITLYAAGERLPYPGAFTHLRFMGGNQVWNCSTLVGSVQLEVIANTGGTEIIARNPKVSKPDGRGSYGVSANQISIVVSDECKVVFETNGGSTVPPKTITKVSYLQRPADPIEHDYRFAGWYHDIDRHFADVKYVSVNGLMNGVGNGLFAPYQNTSRAMIVTILWRLEGKPAAAGEISFTDVPYGQWYTEAVRWASEMGIVTGYSAEAFGSNDIITREQMAAILYRNATAKGHDTTIMADLSRFVDCNTVSTWAQDTMAWPRKHP